VARSYESLWLWLGAGFIAVGAALLGVAGGFDAASKVPYSYGTSVPVIVAYVMFGLSLACFTCAIREVPIPYPISRRSMERLASQSGVPAAQRPALPSAPVRIRLTVERDPAAGGFHLVALNRGELGRFQAEIIGIRDQDGRAPLTSRKGWPVPWLDDGSVMSRDLPTAGNSRLDFAYFNLENLREDLEGTKWVRGDHWTFPSLPSPVKVRYSAVRTWQEQDGRFFIVTVRVIRDEPAGYADTEFKIGTEGREPYCREYTRESPTAGKSAADELVPGPAVTDRWQSKNQFISGDLLQLQNNSMSHPAYMRRSPQDPAPASFRVGIVIACEQLPRDTPPTSSIRASFLAFLGETDVMNLIAELADVTGKTWKAWDEHPRFNFGAVLASDDETEVPAAWARLLLPESWASHFGRDPRYANLVLFIEPGLAQVSEVSPASLAAWHRRFTLAIRIPPALGEYLTSDLGLATSSDPAAEVAIWLKARGASLMELVDVDGFNIVPGTQANWFIGLAGANQEGRDANGLARTWVAEMCDSMHVDGHESLLQSLGISGPASNSLTTEGTSSREVRVTPVQDDDGLNSQVGMAREHSPELGKVRMRRERIAASIAVLSALALIAGLVFAANSCDTNRGSGLINQFNTNAGTAVMPSYCNAGGPIVFVVSGREDSPAPALIGSMVSAAMNAIKGSSPIGLVSLDGRPELVAAGIFTATGNPVAVDQARIMDFDLIAEAVSHVRAKSPHADVLDALEVAADAVRSACGHGGTIYVLDSGLQDIGPVNFREPKLLSTRPSNIVAELQGEHELPHLQGISIVLVGFGYTSPPQSQLSIAQQTNLIAIWSAIAKAGGAASVRVDPTPRGAPAPTQVPPVQLVPTS
jgi:hypothetical protein